MPASQGFGLDAARSWQRRARFSVSVGCPSFGGRRTAGRFSVPPAKSAKRLKRWRYVTVQQCLRSWPKLGVGTATGSVLPSRRAGQTETAAVPVLHSQASVRRVVSPVSSGPSVLHGKSITVGASPVPNPSVKGTSRRRAAPYVERYAQRTTSESRTTSANTVAMSSASSIQKRSSQRFHTRLESKR
jgi:hypothetical protein